MAIASTLVNYTSGASAAAAPATFTLTVPATANGSIGVFLVAAALSGAPTVSTPAGYSLIASNSTGSTLFCGMYSSNGALAAGTTTVVITTLTNVNGIATAFYELGNMSQTAIGGGNIDATCRGMNNVGSFSATSVGGNIQPINNNCFLIGVVFQLTGQALTRTSTPSAIWVNDAAATSTNGATNAVITPQHAFLGPVPVSPPAVESGTFGAAVSCNSGLIAALSSLSAPYVLVEAGGSGSSAVHAMGAYAGGIGG